MEVIPLTGAQRAPLDVLAERTQQGYAVALLSDRDLSRRGIEVEFFGGRTRMPAGPAMLALRTGAPLYAVDIHYTDDQAVASITRMTMPPQDAGALDVRVKLVTQQLADAFAAGIAAHPQDWHMLQRLWLGGGDHADRDRLALLVRRAGRRAEPHRRPRRGADRARAHGQRARARRRGRRPAAVRGARRARGPAAVQ